MKSVRLSSVILLFFASTAAAQLLNSHGGVVEIASSTPGESRAIEGQTYGTADLTWLTLNAWDFRPTSSATTFNYTPVSGFGMFRTGGNPWFLAPLHLPAGAIVSAIEIHGCDTNASDNLVVYFDQLRKPDSVYLNPPGAAATAGATGCQAVMSTFAGWTVDNDLYSYMVELNFNTVVDSSMRITSVRVGYKLQVSPAPGTATFADVPVGHPFHRFVEALADAGITAGCGGGNFCPGDPITRGQMAVFLSAALGLHWTP